MPCYPGYRYCGPGCSGPGAPLNQLDEICLEHDACYRQNGSEEICDQHFLNQVQPLVDQPGKMGRDAAIMYLAIKFKQFF